MGCLQTHVHKQPIVVLYFESENELKLYNLEARYKLCWSKGTAGVGVFVAEKWIEKIFEEK